jgi:hypothetical protein
MRQTLLLAQSLSTLLTRHRFQIIDSRRRSGPAPIGEPEHLQLSGCAIHRNFQAIADPHAMPWLYALAI